MKHLFSFSEFLTENNQSVYGKIAKDQKLGEFLAYLVNDKSMVMDNTKASPQMDDVLSMVKNEKYSKPLYRGLYTEKIEDFAEGKDYVFDRYQSFSEKEDIAKKFSKNGIIIKATSSIGGFNYGGYFVNYYEDMKKTDPANYDAEDGDYNIKAAQEEAEWIFARNTTFKVEKISQSGRFTVIEGIIT